MINCLYADQLSARVFKVMGLISQLARDLLYVIFEVLFLSPCVCSPFPSSEYKRRRDKQSPYFLLTT